MPIRRSAVLKGRRMAEILPIRASTGVNNGSWRLFPHILAPRCRDAFCFRREQAYAIRQERRHRRE